MDIVSFISPSGIPAIFGTATVRISSSRALPAAGRMPAFFIFISARTMNTRSGITPPMFRSSPSTAGSTPSHRICFFSRQKASPSRADFSSRYTIPSIPRAYPESFPIMKA